MKPILRASLDTPIGPLTVTVENGAVSRLDWRATTMPDDDPTLTLALTELAAYFAGTLTHFTVPLRPGGTAFQQTFRAALCAIPFGQTRTYGHLAAELNVSAQAIGQACGANPIPVLIPCHRVLATCGLGGYSGAGGVQAKVTLLRLEGAASLLI